MEAALASVRFDVKSRETANVTLGPRLAFKIVCSKLALKLDGHKDVHLVDVRIENSRRLIFQEPLVRAAKEVRPDMVFRDWRSSPEYPCDRK